MGRSVLFGAASGGPGTIWCKGSGRRDLATISSLRRIAFDRFPGNGVLTVFPSGGEGVPFPIMRVFTVAGVSPNGRRANHAHRDCSQMLACLAGGVDVSIDDGSEKTVERLGADGPALLIPPMLWNSVAFDGPSTVLAVFCDMPYDEADYITDWKKYLRLRGL